MSKQPLAVLAVLMGTGLAAVTWAQPPGPMGRGSVPPFARIKEAIGLSDAQVDQLAKLLGEQRKLMIRRRADMQVEHLELQDLMLANTVDERAVAAKVKEVTDLQAAALKARVDAHLALRKVLTPEQVQKMRMLHMFLSRDHAGAGFGLQGGPMGGSGDEGGFFDEELSPMH